MHAAEFAIGAVEIRKQDEADGEGENADGVEENGHGLGQSQVATHAGFATVHLALIGFVIVAQQMQDAVDDQDAHFDEKVRPKRRAFWRATAGAMAMSPK